MASRCRVLESMLRDQFPFLLREAVISLYLTDAAGNPITSAPVWCGAVANSLKLGLTWQEGLSFSSGDAYKTAHHEDEMHTIDIERTWVIRSGTPAEAAGPERNGRYVMEIIWNDVRERIWHKRVYYGVTGRSSDLVSEGARQLNNPQSYRAERFTRDGGTGLAGIYTPVATIQGEQVAAFFGEDPLLTGSYLLGHYRWSSAKRIIAARWACWSPQATTTLALEIDGVLTGDTVTIPSGTANVDVRGSVTLNRSVSAASEVRWKVTSGPDIEEAAWHLGLVTTLVDG